MAPLPSLGNVNTLSPRYKKYEVDYQKEIAIVKLLFGFIIAAIAIFIGCTM